MGVNEPAQNSGNFLAYLRFNARFGNGALRNRSLTQSMHNIAMYASLGIKIELIGQYGNAIQARILKRVSEAGFFAVLADETQDIFRREQLVLCLRYVDCSLKNIGKDFLEFIYTRCFSSSVDNNYNASLIL